MNDKVQEGLFEEGRYFPEAIPQNIGHQCAKCGTGYAGPECGQVNGVGPNSSRFVAYDRSPADQEARDLKIGPYDPDAHESTITDLLGGIIGEDVSREGLAETPKRVVKAWKAMTAGYAMEPGEVLKTFEDGAEGSNGQWVIVKDIPIYSNCEHHMLPFFGTATIGYVANSRVVGLSKLARLADVYAKRLQVQERLTNQIAEALIQHLDANAAMVIINCRHFCMEARGIAKTGSSTVTQSYRTAPDLIPDAVRDYRASFYDVLGIM